MPTRTTPRTSEQVAPTAGPLATTLASLDPVDLPQLDRAQLHDRVESKVLFHVSAVPRALSLLAADYLVLEHDGMRSQHYRTSYFDSSRLRSYHEHHNQKRRRFKVRYRTYLNSGITFFEIKRNVDGRTVKERIPSSPPGARVWPGDAAFLAERAGIRAGSLEPSLSVEYRRILLVARDYSERVTIDIGLHFTARGATHRMSQVAIGEFKQPSFDRHSPAMTALGRRPVKFSKYCMGLASCRPSLRHNRFKKNFLRLRKLTAQSEPGESR